MSATGWIILVLAVLLVLATLVAIYLWRKAQRAGGSPPAAQVDAQLELEKLRAEVRALIAKQGVTAARSAVLVKYQEQLKTLTDQQTKQAQMLEEDPVALATFLVQAGRTGGCLLGCLLVAGLLAFGLPSRGSAQERAEPPPPAGDAPAPTTAGTTCDAGDAKKCSTPLQAGQVAPYAGQLLTPRLAVDLGQRAQGCDARMELAVQFAQDSAQVDLRLERSLRENDLKASAEREKILQDALQAAREAQKDPWYEHPAFVATISVVLTVGLVVAVGYALQAVEEGTDRPTSTSQGALHLSSPVSSLSQPALLRF
ncbi:MAG: hypothetical protein WC789_06965 [Lentisphaeria bacterium]